MITKSIPKIWLLSVNFEKFEVNFSKLTDNNQILKKGCDCVHYHLYKIPSQNNECKIFAPYDFLEIKSISGLSLSVTCVNEVPPVGG